MPKHTLGEVARDSGHPSLGNRPDRCDQIIYVLHVFEPPIDLPAVTEPSGASYDFNCPRLASEGSPRPAGPGFWDPITVL